MNKNNLNIKNFLDKDIREAIINVDDIYKKENRDRIINGDLEKYDEIVKRAMINSKTCCQNS